MPKAAAKGSLLWIGFGSVGTKARSSLLNLSFQLNAVRRSLIQPYEHPLFKTLQGDACLVENWLDWLAIRPDTVIITLSPTEYKLKDYLQTYYLPLLAFKKAVLKLQQGLSYEPQVVFVSSSSIYGENTGAWVTEDSQVKPSSQAGKVMLLCESFLQEAFGSGYILRASGIYSEARIRSIQILQQPPKNGRSRWTNRIHESDLARSIVYFCEKLQQEQQGWSVVNVTDNQPFLHLSIPDKQKHTKALEEGAQESITWEGMRISNRKLQSYNFQLQHPNILVPSFLFAKKL